MNRWKTLSGLGVLLLHFTATAQVQTSVQACIQKAQQLYENLQYEAALGALRCPPQRVLTEEERVSVLLFKGVFLAELLRKEEASSAFTEALRLRPGALLPVEVSPKINLQFEAVRATLAIAITDLKKHPAEPGSPPSVRPPFAKPPPRAPPTAAPPAPSPSDAAQPEESAEPTPKELRLPIPLDDTPPAHPAKMPQSQALGPGMLVPASAGALVTAGGVFLGLAWKEHQRLASGSPELKTYSDVKGSASRGSIYQTVGFSLMGAGLVGLGVAVGLHGLGKPDSPVELSVWATGSQVVIRGRWL